MLGLNDKVFLRLRHDMTASNLLYIIALCGCYIIPQKIVTKEKSTPPPWPTASLRYSTNQAAAELAALRQSSPNPPLIRLRCSAWQQGI